MPIDSLILDQSMNERKSVTVVSTAIESQINDDVLGRVGTLCSVDNDMGRRFLAPLFLSIPQVLHTIGVAPDSDKLLLGVELAGGRATHVELSPGAPPGRGSALARYAGAGNQAAMTPVPLYLHHPDTFYWHKFIPEEKILYFQMNAVLDAGHTAMSTPNSRIRR